MTHPWWLVPLCLLESVSALASHAIHKREKRIRSQSMLSSGLYDNETTLELLRLNVKKYKEAGMINAFGPLLYSVSEEGAFVPNSFGKPKDGNLTGLEFVQRLQKETALDVYPYLFCDNTIGPHCAPDGIAAVLKGDPRNFYSASVQEAKKYGWKGYQVDVEGMSSAEELHRFCEEWGRRLHAAGLQLQVWSSGGIPDPKVLSQSQHIDLVIDMDAYNHQYNASMYGEKMKSWHSLVGKGKAGVGYLTPNNGGAHLDSQSVRQICQALLQNQAAQINFWASVIHDSFEDCLCTYLSVPCSKEAASGETLQAPMLAEVWSDAAYEPHRKARRRRRRRDRSSLRLPEQKERLLPDRLGPPQQRGYEPHRDRRQRRRRSRVSSVVPPEEAASDEQLQAPVLAEVSPYDSHTEGAVVDSWYDSHTEAAGLPEGADGAAFLQLPDTAQEL